jgi:hypothetical protein
VRDGRLVLEPAFHLDMQPHLPSGDGPYRVSGYDEAGAQLFSYGFAGTPVDHANGRHFAFAIPDRLARTGSLARLEVTGPEGRAWQVRAMRSDTPPAEALQARIRGSEMTLSWQGSGYPMALIRDAETGQILSFARGGSARVNAAGNRLEVLMSDGIGNVRAPVLR